MGVCGGSESTILVNDFRFCLGLRIGHGEVEGIEVEVVRLGGGEF